MEIVLAHGASGTAASMRPHIDGLRERGLDARAIDLPVRKAEAAVDAYAALIKQFPGDERVGVAALELGRLRMDTQRAYGPAVEAFRRAIAAAPNEGIREDALARLIEALDALGDQATCAQEQRRYQVRYPRGVHAAAVRGRCASRK